MREIENLIWEAINLCVHHALNLEYMEFPAKKEVIKLYKESEDEAVRKIIHAVDSCIQLC